MEASLQIMQTASLMLLMNNYLSEFSINNTELCDIRDPVSPKGIQPVHYNLFIHPRPETLSYQGEVDIGVKVADISDKSFKQIASDLFGDIYKSNRASENCVNAGSKKLILRVDKTIFLQNIDYWDQGPKKRKDFKVVKVCRDLRKSLLAVTLDKDLVSGSQGIIRIKFSGTIHDDQVGINLRGSCVDDIKQDYILTRFPPRDFSSVFPSFRIEASIPQNIPSMTLSIVANYSDNIHAMASSELAQTELFYTKIDGKVVEKRLYKFTKYRLDPRACFAFIMGNLSGVGQKIRSRNLSVTVDRILQELYQNDCKE